MNKKNFMMSQKISEMFSNLEKCRSCKTVQVEMINFNFIFDEYPTLTVRQAFSECTNLRSEIIDNLPEQICLNCEKELRIAYNFKKKCENSDIYFRECLMRSDTVTSTTICKPSINIKTENLEEDYAADSQICDPSIVKREVDEVTKSNIEDVKIYEMPNEKFDQCTRSSVIVSANQKHLVKTEYGENLFHAENDGENRYKDDDRPQNSGTVGFLERITECAFVDTENSADCCYIDDNVNTKECVVLSDDSAERSPSFPVCFVDCDVGKGLGNNGVLVRKVEYEDEEETRSNVEDVNIENIDVVRPQSPGTVSFFKRITEFSNLNKEDSSYTDDNKNIKKGGPYSVASAKRRKRSFSVNFLDCDVKKEHDYCEAVRQIKNEPKSNDEDSENESETHTSKPLGNSQRYSFCSTYTVAKPHKCSHCNNSYEDLITVQNHEWSCHKKPDG